MAQVVVGANMAAVSAASRKMTMTSEEIAASTRKSWHRSNTYRMAGHRRVDCRSCRALATRNEIHGTRRGSEHGSRRRDLFGIVLGSVAAAITAEVARPEPADARVSYQDVLDFDEETLQRVLSAGNFSTDGSVDDLRRRVLRVLQLDPAKNSQAGIANNVLVNSDQAQQTGSSDQIRKLAKPIELSKDTPNPIKVVFALFGSSATLLTLALLLERAANEESGVLPAIAKANKLSYQAMEEFSDKNEQYDNSQLDTTSRVISDDLSAEDEAGAFEFSSASEERKDFLDERENSELSEDEKRLQEAVINGIKSARAKRDESTQGKGVGDAEAEKPAAGGGNL